MFQYLENIGHKYKFLIILCTDLTLLFLSFFISLVLRLNDPWPLAWFVRSLDVLILMAIIATLLMFFLKFHQKKISSLESIVDDDVIILSIILTMVAFIANIYFDMGAPRTVPLIAGLLYLLSFFCSRSIALKLFRKYELRGFERIPVAIYGAGQAGQQLAQSLTASRQYKPVIFIDKNPNLHGLTILGFKIHKPSELDKFVKDKKVQEVLLAMPSLSLIQKRKISKKLSKIGCKIQELPSYEELIRSRNLISSLKTFSPDMLLGRSKVQVDIPQMATIYKNANVLVSGGGGSIGSELCRKIIEIGPKRLVVYDASEFNLYMIKKELESIAVEKEIEIISILGSISDHTLLTKVFKEYNISVILHAAAYKQLSLVESNIIEGIKNNVFGTKIIAETAILCGIKHFTYISTDKAVNPTSVMGATKRLAELILHNLHYDKNNNCSFVSVRFGNVLGSSGSVIPLFKKQIEQGGPLVISHEDVTRYFMTISEAAHLVLAASSYSSNGNIFVLDMGKPLKIIDIARRMVEIAGFKVRDENSPDGDIEIKIGKLSPGEKLHEELFISQRTSNTPHPKILSAEERALTSDQVNFYYEELQKHIYNQDAENAKIALFKAINEEDLVMKSKSSL